MGVGLDDVSLRRLVRIGQWQMDRRAPGVVLIDRLGGLDLDLDLYLGLVFERVAGPRGLVESADCAFRRWLVGDVVEAAFERLRPPGEVLGRMPAA